MSDVNVFTCTGNVGTHELKPMQNGKNLLVFTLAVDVWNSEEKKEETNWWTCKCFGDLYAEKVVHKGQSLTVSGPIIQHKYNDKMYYSIIVKSIKASGGKKETSVELPDEDAHQEQELDDDAIPF